MGYCESSKRVGVRGEKVFAGCNTFLLDMVVSHMSIVCIQLHREKVKGDRL